MKHRLYRTRATLMALCALVGVTLVAVPPADAATTVTVRSDGALRARGAAIVVVVQVACPSVALDNPPSLTVSATQRLADGSLLHGNGFGGAQISCDGSPHAFRIAVVPADLSSRAFRLGAVF